MRNEHERLARQWAEQVDPRYPASALEEAARDYILATTTKPSMDEVEWDDEKHFLAGAVYEYDEHTCPVVMIGETQDSLGIYSVDLDENTGFWPSLEDLTPNGKRYELREVTVSSGENIAPDQPDHPQFLKTVEDYEDAPEGTVVDICGTVAIRQRYGWCVTGYRYKLDNDEMVQQGEGVAVRWGE